MARSSQTDVAVLAVLSVRPMTGYAVREAIRDQLGHFWSESFGQIYPTLSRLSSAGLIEKRDDGWSLTTAGREKVVELLRSPDAPTPPRNGLLLRIFFGHTLGPAACAALVAEARAKAIAQLDQFASIRSEMRLDVDPPQHAPYWAMTLSAGEHSARATVAWADETLAALERLPARE